MSSLTKCISSAFGLLSEILGAVRGFSIGFALVVRVGGRTAFLRSELSSAPSTCNGRGVLS
jgi:hypothetical protein